MSEFSLIIEGADGSRWPVHGKDASGKSVRLLEGSVGELYDAPLSTTYRSRVGQAGADYRGHRWLERRPVLTLAFFGDGWERDEMRFHRALRPDRDATLVVRTGLSGERRLTVRLEEAPETDRSRDPYSEGVVIKQYSLVAADPYWYEPQPATDEFKFDGSNWTGGYVTVSNPTDVDCWPRWVLTAPAKFGLPDMDLTRPEPKQRYVYLPFQPYKREVLVDTDPMEEMIVANDATLMWARMDGQFFQHPIPAFTPETQLPVYVDPFPLLPFDLPVQWRIWIASRLSGLVKLIGVDRFLEWSPEKLGNQLAEWVREATPSWVPEIPADWVSQMTGTFLTEALGNTFGRISNIAGATAQIRMDRRWQRPWG